MGILDFLGGGAAGVKVGERAPDFSLPDAEDRTFRLSERRGKQPVVLYFYPKDDTPGCTREACGFRDAYEEFRERGAEVVGVSSDSGDSHRRFAAKHRLPFTLLSDADGAVRRLYGVPATLGLLPGRVTFVIDRDGVVRHVLNSQLDFKRHVAESLESLAAQAAGR